MAYNENGEHDKAIADFIEAIRLDPKDALAYAGRGFSYAEKDDYDKAIADYNEAIGLNPKGVLAYVGRGFDVRIAVPFDESLADGLKAAAFRCADACPTGALARRKDQSCAACEQCPD